MRAARLEQHNEPLVIGDFLEPEIAADEVLVRVDAVGVCRTDWHQWKGDWEWLGFLFPLPLIPGHEFAGTVVEVGSAVARIKNGDRVTVPFHEGCGTCESCTAGSSNRCLNLSFPGFTHSGAFGELVAVAHADFNCVVLPENVDAASAATLSCRYMSAYRAVARQGRLEAGESIAIHGAGGMGLAAVQIAKRLGGQIVVVDKRKDALTKALDEGADSVVVATESLDVVAAVRDATGGGAHVSIDAIGGQETSVNCIASLRRAGRFVQAGLTTKEFKGNVTIPMDLVVALELEIVGSFGNPRSDYNALMSMVARGQLNPGSLVTRRANIAEINSIIEDLDGFDTVGVNVIDSFTPNGGES
ncbi:alcohol dehydrogenase catalytic domain-containing protein [Mycolicibacterium gadium]|uniref:Alcohol dehydrogenase catalytic domain-containing protein n=1 Tax=Mycolicibacterium gadium TaxID=1794 RepID=A0ABT6GZB5_MYCGU|nr:alcohol dehydrogenase catalytic domain-containing protein [Mycolicibacterium gadium]MDG5486694.1 alcohol dehydrogenase catalytic domain-containing protein [Mycolicibacterium gadium]